MPWPWVSREVLTAKDETIALLRAENERLLARLDNPAPVQVHVDLPEGLIVTQPAIIRRARKPESDQPPEPKIDYANIDENDPAQMGVLALKELGPTPNKYLLRQFLRQARVQIRAARDAKHRPQTPSETVKDGDVPDAIRQMIQQ